MKLGVVGVGGMGGNHCKAIAEMTETELTAVCDVSAETAQRVADETGAQPYHDFEQMIREAGLEGVVIATPHYFHPPLAEYAAQHGVHVLSEKPIAVSVAAADKMVETCRSAGVLLGVMFQQRLDPARLKMKQMIDAGVLGPRHRISMTVPWYRSQAYYNSGAWRGTWKGEGGGILMNQAPHSLDQFLWLGGAPRSVQGIARTRLHQIEVENTDLSILDYENGQVGWFYVSTAEVPGGETVEVAGDNGVLEMRNGQLRHFQLKEPLSEHLRGTTARFGGLEGEWHEVEIEKTAAGHQTVVRRFVQAVQENDESLLVANGEDGLRALELGNAMLMAGYTRCEVTLPLDRDKFGRMLQRLQDGASPAEFHGQSF
jgi:predicted dehydrogenase